MKHTVLILKILFSMFVFAFFGLILACLNGCVYTSYTGKDGVSLKRISLFGDQSAARVDLSTGTIEGYKSEQAQIAGAVAGEVAKALVKP
jgi:hypothetical protein